MNNNHHEHHGGSGFFNGFLLGAIIGAAVVFFLFTDKGKKLLKTIMEEGSEGFSEFKDLIQEEMDEDEEGMQPVHSIATTQQAEHSHVEPIHAVHHPHVEYHETPHHSSSPKRFFKGPKRG